MLGISTLTEAISGWKSLLRVVWRLLRWRKNLDEGAANLKVIKWMQRDSVFHNLERRAKLGLRRTDVITGDDGIILSPNWTKKNAYLSAGCVTSLPQACSLFGG